jgi:hypothetical protein
LGSFITMTSTIFFAFVVFITLTSNRRSGFNSWRNTTNFNFFN